MSSMPLLRVVRLQRFVKRWVAKRRALRERAIHESRETALHALEERQKLLQAAIHAGHLSQNEALDESNIFDTTVLEKDGDDPHLRLWLEYQLNRVPLLTRAGLSRREYTILSRAMKPKTYQPGDVVISQGDAVRYLYVLQQGAVDVFQKVYTPTFETTSSENSNELVPEMEDPNALPTHLRHEPSKRVATLGVGQILGDQALLGQSASLLTAIASASAPYTIIWLLSRRDLVSLLGADRLKTRMALSMLTQPSIPTEFKCILSKTSDSTGGVSFRGNTPHTMLPSTDERLAARCAVITESDQEVKIMGDISTELYELLRAPQCTQTLITALQRCPMLRSFGRAELLRIAKQMIPIAVHHGEAVIRAGNRPFALYAIASGSVRVYASAAEAPLGLQAEQARHSIPSLASESPSCPTTISPAMATNSNTSTPLTVQQRLLQRRASIAAAAATNLGGASAEGRESTTNASSGGVDAEQVEKARREMEAEDAVFKTSLSSALQAELDASDNTSLVFRRELFAGDIFGELALMLNSLRTATVIARSAEASRSPSSLIPLPEASPTPTFADTCKQTILWALPRDKLAEQLQQASQRNLALVEGCLARVPEFASLTPDEISRAAEALEIVHYSKGKCIVREGAPGKTFFIIKSGQVQVVKAVQSSSGTTDHSAGMVQGVQVGILGPGEYFGERALLTNQPRQASCIAQTDVECFYLHSMHFHAIFGKARAAMLAKIASTDHTIQPPSYSPSSVGAIPMPEIPTQRAPEIDLKQSSASLLTPPRHIVRRTSMAFSDGTNFGLKGWMSTSAQLGTEHELSMMMTPMIPRKGIHRRTSISIVPAQMSSSAALALYDIRNGDTATQHLGPGAFLCRDPERWRSLLPAFLRASGFSRTESFRVVAQTFACDLFADFLVCDTTSEGKGYCLRVVSRKVFNALPIHVRRRFATACAIERGIVHPFLCKTYCAVEDVISGSVLAPKSLVSQKPNAVCILRDFAHAGTIADLLARGQFRGRCVLDDHAARFVVASVILALEALHAGGIAHRALTPDSLLVTRAGYVRLTDFTAAKFMSNGSRTFTICEQTRTRGYAAPEQLLCSGYSGFSVDWWGLGCLAFELLAGYPPFYDPDPRVSVALSLSGEIQHWPSTIGAHARTFISQLLQPRAHKRLGVIHDSARLLRSAAWFATPCTITSIGTESSTESGVAPEPNVVSVAGLFAKTASGLTPPTQPNSVETNDSKSSTDNDSAFAEAAVYASLPFSFASLAMQVMPSPLDPGITSGDDLSMLRVDSYTTDQASYWKCPELTGADSGMWMNFDSPLPQDQDHDDSDSTDADWAELF